MRERPNYRYIRLTSAEMCVCERELVQSCDIELNAVSEILKHGNRFLSDRIYFYFKEKKCFFFKSHTSQQLNLAHVNRQMERVGRGGGETCRPVPGRCRVAVVSFGSPR